ncbi:hypothetical protein [Mesorhizobium sp.]|nr:hypothetical protein [Mesorhizobium sp.]
MSCTCSKIGVGCVWASGMFVLSQGMTVRADQGKRGVAAARTEFLKC